MAKIRFAGYPVATVYADKAGKEPKQQLLWGDWLSVINEDGDWLEVFARKSRGWIRRKETQTKRVLEIVFVDIGQGDGALIVTPDDKHILVDAGQEDNMYRFLRWKYGQFKTTFDFEAVVISHPDQDHYNGFTHILKDPNVTVRALYHNGIVERTGAAPLGPRVKDGEASYVSHIVQTSKQLKELLTAPNRGKKLYPNLLHRALESNRVDDVRALSSADKYLPSYGPSDNRGLVIEVLGPVLEPDAFDQPRLRWFGDAGKTKNGHSIVLRIKHGNVSILLGGDLNIPAEQWLLTHHTGLVVPPATDTQRQEIIRRARKKFRSDVAKACHHGSADFTDLFLESVDPIVTVISSGDDEPHSHPRADSLGALGRFGRGRRPLVFSTELARSAPETVAHPNALRASIRTAQRRVAEAAPGKRKKAEAALDKILNSIDRSVAVYGAINLRTDGDRVLMAQRIEQRATSITKSEQDGKRRAYKKWDIYKLEHSNGELRYVSKHGEDPSTDITTHA